MLLERDGEIAELRAALAGAAAGRGRILVVQGAPGVGKTRLLAAASDHARAAGLSVLTAQGRELEREIALGVAVDLLAPTVATTGAEERARLLSGPAQLAAALFPGAGGIEAPPYPAPDAMLLGLCWLVADLTGGDRLGAAPARATLLVVDDAQWADSASLTFLAMLADRVPRLPLVMVIAVRDGDAGSNTPLLHRLAAAPHGRLLVPAPLTTEAVDRLVTAVFPAAGRALAHSIAHASGGNPFLIGELLRSLRADEVTPAPATVAGLVPGTVLRSVLARLGRLPPDAGTLADSVAVLGDGAPLHRAAAHAGLELVAAERAADVLAEARLLQPGNPLTFTHPLIGAAVHADLPAFTRSRAHRRAADLLAADGVPADKVAGHLLVVEPEGDPWVVDVLREAADRALRLGDPAAAARLLTRAVAEPPAGRRRGHLLVDLARAQITAGDHDAETSLAGGLDLLDPADTRARARALSMLAQIRFAHADRDGAGRACQEALDLLDPAEPDWQDALTGYLTVARFHPPLRSDATRRLLPVLEDARAGAAPSRPGLAAHLTLTLALAGDPPARVRRLAEHALAIDPLVGGDQGVLLALVVHALVIAGELVAAETAADAGLAAARQRGDLLAYGYASYHRALTRLHRGALTAALADLEASQAPAEAGWTEASGWNAWLVAELYHEYGDQAAARQALDRAGERPEHLMEAALLRHAHAQLALAEGNPREALEAAGRAGRQLKDNHDIDHPGLLPWRRTAALAAHQLGDHEQAHRLAAAAVERAREVAIPQAVGAALRVAGLVAAPTPDLSLLSEAVAALRDTPAALEHARALVDLGAALRHAGQHGASREPLRQGLALADHMHATPLAERARAELGILGHRPRRAAITGIDALTDAERQVALLALHGHSNREIADSLSVTTKTVETHLTRAYRKLAITSRRQLESALAHRPPR